jgi:hypothetical protein
LVSAIKRGLYLRRRDFALDKYDELFREASTELSAMEADKKCGLSMVPGMDIEYVVKDAKKWEVNTEKRCFGIWCWILWQAAGQGMR